MLSLCQPRHCHCNAACSLSTCGLALLPHAPWNSRCPCPPFCPVSPPPPPGRTPRARCRRRPPPSPPSPPHLPPRAPATPCGIRVRGLGPRTVLKIFDQVTKTNLTKSLQRRRAGKTRSAEVVGARLPAHLLIDAAQQGSASRVSLTGIGELFTRGSREGACASGGAAREHAHGTLSAFPTRLNLVERAAGPRRMRTVLASSGAQLLAAEPRPPLRTARPDCGLSSCGAPGERWEMCVQQH